MPFINGVTAARERIVARNDDERAEFLRKRGFRHSQGNQSAATGGP
jgi:hypothetical protein